MFKCVCTGNVHENVSVSVCVSLSICCGGGVSGCFMCSVV